MQFTTQQKFVDTFRNSVTTFSIDKRGCCKSGKINATKTFNSNNFQISQDSKNKNQQLLQEGGLLWEDSTKLQEEFGFIDKFLQSQDVLEVPEAGQLSDTTQAIILAGGSSSNPLAQYRAIAATPLGSNLKVIDSTIHNCMKSGIDKIYVLTQFNSQPLNSYISNSYKPTIFGRQHSWVEVLASNQTPQYKAWARGSADAVRRNFPTLLNRWHGAELPQEFLIVSAEAVCSIDYTKLLTAHRLMGADITMATTSVEADKASSLGLCIIDPLTCKVLDFAEKPCAEKLKSMKGQDIHSTERMPYEASMGIYVFNRQVLVELLEGQEDNNSHNNEHSQDFIHFGSDVIPHALRSYRVCAYHHGGYWKNLATLQNYFQVNLELLNDNAQISLQETSGGLRSVEGGKILPPSTVHNSNLDNCLLGEGCIVVGATLKNVIVGDNTIIANATRIEDSMIWGADYYFSYHNFKHSIQTGLPAFEIGRAHV
eukprot:TRINITY_DN4215_c0_g1_i5.p1 TRINITY_DN4215_c0_g1~~TRINITY_DN4215_c0_g1_i5.p1  ORF type:complete len:483 (+),score=61.54 TRINITY_DN4215_c0_g1_i5:76-1524(+)